MNIASRKPVQGEFYAHILDSNMFIFLKLDTVDNNWEIPTCENRYLCNCRKIIMFFFLSNQKPSLCHGIYCGSYEIGTLAIVVHLGNAPHGFIVEECSRGVNGLNIFISTLFVERGWVTSSANIRFDPSPTSDITEN